MEKLNNDKRIRIEDAYEKPQTRTIMMELEMPIMQGSGTAAPTPTRNASWDFRKGGSFE